VTGEPRHRSGAPSARARVKRLPERGYYDRATIDAIIDEALLCHVGFVADDGQPFVIPTLHGRDGDTVYLHGSSASRMLRSLAGGVPACVTFTLVDALVLARSLFHHSANYRSAVLLGKVREVTDDAERMHGLEVVSEHLLPGRWEHARTPNAQEMKATKVCAIDIDEASAKVRTGPPGDDDADLAQVLLRQLERIDEGRAGDDRRPVLVVVEDGDL
jgi:nitroimidazol reductase NimA-like FMN-containing flavoprotein (pyridoxamine 5'-phosphate oxidase superfamily)